MKRTIAIGLVLAVLLLGGLAAPATAEPAGDRVDECQNVDRGPGADGPPGFVAGLVPDFLGDLVDGLPVPNVVKAFFGAPTC